MRLTPTIASLYSGTSAISAMLDAAMPWFESGEGERGGEQVNGGQYTHRHRHTRRGNGMELLGQTHPRL